MAIPGKIQIRILDVEDIPIIEKFCQQCRDLGYENNASLKAMKFDSATFFGAFIENKLFSLAGVHIFSEINQHAYRCLFRGAQLPGFTPTWSMDIFKSGIHFSYLLFEQINYVLNNDDQAEFYITTNISNPKAGSSSKLDKIMMPRLASKGYCSLYRSNYYLHNVEQNIWKINLEEYLAARSASLSNN